MALLIQKFGGTSVGTLDRIRAVADQVIASRQAGNDVVVVVSAMSGETDRLISMAKEMSHGTEPEPREYAALVSTGEQVSMALLGIALNARGYKARCYNGSQAQIHTDPDYKKARILHVSAERLRVDLQGGCIPIVAGFQGMAANGDVTTLGRGGSDTTAVALAVALRADECQIFTDVDGIYTTDPRVVPEARRLDHITFEEMLELASLGAKVLQIRSVEFAGKYQIPLRVLSSFTEGSGTLITFEHAGMEQPLVSGIAFNRNEAKLTILGVPDKPGIAAHILGPISAANVDVDMIVQNVAVGDTIDFTFTVHRDDYQKAHAILEQAAKSLDAKGVTGDTKIAKLSLVGVGMRSHAGIAATMFNTLGVEGINIQLITTSEIKISVVIDEKYLELGVRALHAAYHLDTPAKEERYPAIPA